MKPETKRWLDMAQNDYESSLILFKAAKHPQAVYLIGQAIEKILKAAQIEIDNFVPTKIHNLENLAHKSGLGFSEDQIEALRDLTSHYGKVRYPDYKKFIYNTKAKVKPIINRGEKIYLWILTALKNH